MPFPGDRTCLRQSSIENAAVKKEDEDRDGGGLPAFHRQSRHDQKGSQSKNDRASPDVNGVAPANEPGAQTADNPDKCERLIRMVFRVAQ